MRFDIKVLHQVIYGFILLCCLSSCRSKVPENDYREVFTIQPELLHRDANAFLQALEDLNTDAKTYRDQQLAIDSLQQSVRKARLSFKKVEYFLSYHYPGFTKSKLNPAPLLDIEKSSGRPSVVPPEGLQLLDEIVYSTEAEDKKYKIAQLSQRLVNNFKDLNTSLQQNLPETKAPFQMMRLELIRIFTLGLTGFDTPGSLNIAEEAIAALSGIQEQVNAGNGYSDLVKIEQHLQQTIDRLKGEEFESLDRLDLLRNFIDPLYALMGNAALSDEVKLETSWNPQSTSIFSSNFLNPYFFTTLTAEKDSPGLKKLGKELFYDENLSHRGVLNCANCHSPEKYFTDSKARSVSNVSGKNVLRNAPTLINAVYADRYFYDMRAFSLEQQAEHVIFNPEEFNTAFSQILSKLKTSSKYRKIFKKVFGQNGITRDNFSAALSAYVLSLRSFDSTFDQYVRRESAKLDNSAQRGFNLFMGKANCATCHFAPLFSGLVPPYYRENESEILGVLENPRSMGKAKLDDDPGRFNNTIQSEHSWIYQRSFKTTSVRNVAQTAPYFHNGAYKTLEEVMDFYNNGGGRGHNLKVRNQTLPADSLHLSEQETNDVIHFMESLTSKPSADLP